MDRQRFRDQAASDMTVANFLDEVVDVVDPVSDRDPTAGLLFTVCTYALYRLAKNYFDHQRGLDEAELRQEMLEEVETLVRSGWTRDKAAAAVKMASREIATLRPDSPALKAALALLKGGNAVVGD